MLRIIRRKWLRTRTSGAAILLSVQNNGRGNLPSPPHSAAQTDRPSFHARLRTGVPAAKANPVPSTRGTAASKARVYG